MYPMYCRGSYLFYFFLFVSSFFPTIFDMWFLVFYSVYTPFIWINTRHYKRLSHSLLFKIIPPITLESPEVNRCKMVSLKQGQWNNFFSTQFLLWPLGIVLTNYLEYISKYHKYFECRWSHFWINSIEISLSHMEPVSTRLT